MLCKMARNRRQGYVEGSAARKLQPARHPRKEQRVSRESRQVIKDGKAEYLSVLSLLFLSAMALMVLYSCVHFLQLQEQCTSKNNRISSLETQLENLKNENDDNYTRVMTSMDLDYIRDVAINELGMVYAKADQVILYDGSTKDYVRQNQEIPKE